eukprot:m.70453 g.70453  ORF g.70453 m.70453 type:complete len:343 (+) comp14164_c0_seq1:2-1030(+)
MAEAPAITPERPTLRPGAASYVPPSRRSDAALPTQGSMDQPIQHQQQQTNGQTTNKGRRPRANRRKASQRSSPAKSSVSASPLSPASASTATFTPPPPKPHRNQHSAPGNVTNRGRKGSKARNTESFKPSFESPDIRVVFGPAGKQYPRPVGVHDLIVAPELFCKEEDTSMYTKLIKELQEAGTDSLFVSWHGDSHVIADDKKMGGKWKKLSPTFQAVVDRMAAYFNMDIKATRFNWYRDSKEWKPYHHDRAAFTPDCPQNATVAASFGACRDISFLHAKHGTTVRVPQPNGSMYAFTKEANIDWKHGVMAESPARQHSEGRVSIIAWGWIDMLDWKAEMKL